jgi:diguanylate cyclase (GGDEF)-like protein
VEPEDLKVELLRHALDNTLPALRINILVSGGMVWTLQGPTLAWDWSCWWFVATLLNSGLRWMVQGKLKAEIQTAKANSPQWLRRAWLLHSAGLVVAGALWSALVLFWLHRYPMEQQYMVVMVVASIAGGASGVLAPVRVAGMLYMSMIMLSVCVLMALHEPPQIYLCVIGGLFLGVILGGHRSSHALLRKSIGLRHENRHLVEQLTQRSAEVMAANTELEARVADRTRALHDMAHHDSLTELLNRRGLALQADASLAQAAPPDTDQRHAVLFIDLDHFKQINDGLGHSQGDIVLQGVARRLLASLPPAARIARWGGDEFIVVTPALTGTYTNARCQAGRLAETLRTGLMETFEFESASLQVGGSIGIAIQGEDGETLEQLLRAADLAAAEAKRLGRGRVVFYEEGLSRTQRRKLDINLALRHAVPEQRLRLVFQPVVSAASGALVSVEALLRWNPRDMEAIEPQEFIPHAEESDRILELGAWVLQHACRAAAAWEPVAANLPSVAVNVSMRQLVAPGFAAFVTRTLAISRLPPARLVLEVTESVFEQSNQERILATLQGLGAIGVCIHIDDFGTGYSSLSRLREFPIDGIKIDRSFVAVLDDRALAVVESTVLIAKRFCLKVVAEGIETPAQAMQLHALGVDEFQGFLIGTPQPSASLQDVEPFWLPAPVSD